MKKLIVPILIIYLLISMVGCRGVPTTPPIISSELVLVQVTDPKSNIIFVAGKKNEEAVAVLGEKDIEGKPTGITGAVYVSEQGDSFTIEVGIDGLPTYLIDSEGNTVIFENYTNSTVDISMYDSSGILIQESTTINVESADLLELKQLYNFFYSKGLRGDNENISNVLKWGGLVLGWTGCVISLAAATATVATTVGIAIIVCGNAMTSTLAAITPDDTDNWISIVSGAVSCLTLNEVSCASTILDILNQVSFANYVPVISSLTAVPSSIDINQTTTITCTASDEDVGDTLTYTWTKTDGIFEGSTIGATVTWKAPPTQGNYTVTCEVSDGEASDSNQVIISVGDVNHPPIITSIAVTSATKGQAYSYDVNATDSDGDSLAYSLTTKPSGMTINSSTGLITWTPNATGSFGVTVKAFDGELFDAQSFTVKVEETSTAILPDPPTSLSPGTTSAPGPTISTLTPTLQWQAVPNADYYNLSVSIYPYEYENIIYYNQQVFGNSITVPSGELEAGKKYRWNMRAHNSAGYSDYSSDYYFQTGSLPSTQVERITNSSFSSGTSGWTLVGDFWADTNFSNYHTSPGYAAGGVDSAGLPKNSALGWMYQAVAIPSGATSATLSFWYNITSEETGSTAYDVLNVTIQNSAGNYLATVAVLSNLNKSSLGSYNKVTFDVTSYKGQTIRVHYLASTDSSVYTVFRIDDVSLMSDG